MRNEIAQALLRKQSSPMPPQVPQDPSLAPDQTQSPFMLDQALEQQAAPQNPPMHPIVAAIMQRLGLLNVIRNQHNGAMVAGDQP